MTRLHSFVPVLLFAATTGFGGCSSTATHGDGGGGAAGDRQGGSGGRAGASGSGGAAGQADAGGGGEQADGGACRLQLQTCSDTQRCCSPLICAGNCTMPVTQDASIDARPDCPSAPPTAGGACTATVTCYYQDCAHTGRTVASCGGGGIWSVQTASCATFSCFPGSGRMCTGDQICSESAGGALLVECINNTCGAGPITCGCLSSCSGSCTISGSAQTGFQVNCNTCPSNQCA